MCNPKMVNNASKAIEPICNFNLSLDKRQIYEYYFMKNICNTDNWLFKDYQQMINELGYKEQFTPKVYEKWLSEWTPEKHIQIIGTLQKFVASGDFRLDHRHD